MLFELLLLLLVTAAVSYSQFIWRRKNLYRQASKVPGPKGWPFIGNIDFLNFNSTDLMNFAIEIFKRYPDIGHLWFGPFSIYAIGKPEFIETVLNNQGSLEKMFVYNIYRPIIGSGLFTADVETWKKHRKLILPAFNRRILDSYSDIFIEHLAALQINLDKYATTREVFDVFPLLTHYSFELICNTLMNVKCDPEDITDEFHERLQRGMDTTYMRLANCSQFYDFSYKFTDSYKEILILKEQLNDIMRKILERNRGQGKDRKDKNNDTYVPKKQAFLDLLVNSNQMSDQEIINEMTTFFLAGSDTTANIGSFIFLILAIYPEIQENIYKEVIDVVGAENPASASDLPHLQYTERVIKEALRFFPIAPVVARDVTEDVPLSNEFTLPSGASVIIAIMNVHKNPEYWPNPEKFDPDRFLPEEVSKRHPYAYLPFSSGLRPCPGSRYAMRALKTMIGVLIRKYTISSPYKKIEDIKLKLSMMIKPVDGYNISISTR